ncbi:MAG: 2-dehydropantoate 2-reductase [Pelosinus sp.]|nr:2-dehydropantoate 2-reductase [Pelosinus sp.]
MKLAVIGMGGVGGYIGGLLAKARHDVTYIARGTTLEMIRTKGLQVHSELHGSFIAQPSMITQDVEKIGIVDAVFVCVKGYSIESAYQSIKPIVGKNTLVIPLLNGVGISTKLKGLLGKGIVLDGCMYITSEAIEPGVISQRDKYNKIVIGGKNLDTVSLAKIEQLAAIIRKSGIECIVSNDVEADIWAKYNFNCAFSVVTALYGINAGELRADPKKVEMLQALSQEAAKVAKALGISQPEDIVERSMKIMWVMKDEGTSSLKRDIQAGANSEAELFSGEICRLAATCGVEVPVSCRAYEELKCKIQGVTNIDSNR